MARRVRRELTEIGERSEMGVFEGRVESIFEIGVWIGGIDGRGKRRGQFGELFPEVDSLLVRYLGSL